MIHQSSLQDKLNSFLAGEYRVLGDSNVSEALPPAIIHIFEKGKKEVAERLLRLLIAGLRDREPHMQVQCGTILTESAKLLAEKKMFQPLENLLPVLKIILQGSPDFSLPENIRDAAGLAITAAETGKRENSASPPSDPAGERKDAVSVREEQIFHLVGTGNRDEAKRQLFELIVSCARKRDFTNAERLRERMYEIDSMALMEIIRSGEIIEEEKSGSIDKDLLQIWAGLLKILSPEEFNALCLATEVRDLATEECFVTQGAKNDELFFINRGSIRVSYFQTGNGNGKEIFLENLSSGEIAGENFFDATIWTVSLTAVEPTQIAILKRENLVQLEQRNPGIESKLRDYYNRSLDISALVNKRGIDRRSHKRHRIERKIQIQIVGNNDRVLTTFRGEMDDISQGGLSFTVRINRKENSRFLLGRNIRGILPLNLGGEQKISGLISGVQLCDPVRNDYSVHVKFDRILEPHTLRTILE
ncbi:MAG: cyclic nucleotide-binding domain-containing protein [Desulfobulbaceae bacterium]|nr:cyclic nucleotide-binding domain-containing protein [Desulfobulbaceae bacterium]